MKLNLRRITAGVAAMVMGMSLMACGSSAGNTADNDNNGNTQQLEISTMSTKAAGASTNANVPAAPETPNYEKQLSGKVVVYMPSPSGLNKKYVDGFKNKTGVDVELFAGTTGEILARLEAEKDNPVADVVVLASWSDGLSMKRKNNIMTYTPYNADKMYADWIDNDHTLFGTSASAVGVIYNTTIIDKLDADWSELGDAKYADDIAIPDPQKSGSCKDFISGYMSATNSNWTAFENMSKAGLFNAGANKAALSSVTTGEKAILVAGVDYNAYSSMAKGEPINIYYPKSGTVINPRPAMILKTSKNTDNAKAFVDYLLSDEAQKMVADAYLLPGRSDVKCTNRTNVNEIPTMKVDWDWMMKNSDDIAKKLVDMCK